MSARGPAFFWSSGKFWSLFAISLQVALTIDLGGNAIRIGVSDLLIPLILVVVILHRGLGPAITFFAAQRAIALWLVAAGVWLAISLMIAYFRFDSVIAWALINKLAGWLVLVSYLFVGWVVTMHNPELPKSFCQAFIGFAALTGLIAIAMKVAMQIRFPLLAGSYSSYLQFMENIGPSNSILSFAGKQYFRLQGFFENPNAFGVLIASTAVLLAPSMRGRQLFAPALQTSVMVVLLATVVLSGSRSAWVGLGAGCLALVFLRAVDMRRMLACAVLAAGFLMALELLQDVAVRWSLQQSGQAGAAGPRDLLDYARTTAGFSLSSSAIRWEMTKDAIDHWLSFPVFGGGLGSEIMRQYRAGQVDVVSIHSTPLWLLTETGLVGLFIFGALAVACLRALLHSSEREARMPIQSGTVGVGAVYIGASVGMETLYQRYGWFLFGMAVVATYSRQHEGLRLISPKGMPALMNR